MTNVALQNFTAELVHHYEVNHQVKLSDLNLVERFGFNEAKMIEAFLEGRVLKDSRIDILGAVRALDGDDRDASAILLLCAGHDISRHGIDEEAIVLNDRLMGRLQNMERFLRRIGKLEEFHAWLTEEACEAQSAQA